MLFNYCMFNDALTLPLIAVLFFQVPSVYTGVKTKHLAVLLHACNNLGANCKKNLKIILRCDNNLR